MNKSEILDFIRRSQEPVTKRDIARAFGIKGSGPRLALKQILKELEKENAIGKKGGSYTLPDGLGGVCLVEVHDIDIDGDVFARPVEWDTETQSEIPRIEIMPDKKGHPSVKLGDRVLVRLKRVDETLYEARVLKRLDTPEGRLIGVFKINKNGHARLVPADKKERHEYDVAPKDTEGAKDGDLVLGEIQPSRGLRNKKARVVEIIGRRDDPKAISIISLHEAGIKEDFPDRILTDTKNLKVPELSERQDLRTLPLITIDGADARDFDDAVYAEKTDDGYHLIVAIADVAHYVRSNSPLDQEAQRRGNSTYFPDRVVPMLPEALSNDLCSLRPREDRACLAVHMWIDNEGQLKKFKFVRGLMQSTARLTYEQVQAARDGQTDELTGPLLENVITPLYEAFIILDKARKNRGALELDLPEHEIILNEKGDVTAVKKRQRLDAHRLIEEFMVLANVAAAKAFENKKVPCVYRVHEPPGPDKLEDAHEFLKSFNLSLPKGQAVKPKQINQILLKAAQLPYSHLISTVILRTQSQAHYSPDNKGHFGLALRHYAHFTSPIRRYADLIVHRALISLFGLGKGGLSEEETATLEDICNHISQTERTSMEAERSAIDRFTASFLSERIGATFAGRINGVTRFGLFVELEESGADGLVPMKSLANDFYIHDEQAHALIGRRSGRVFRLGASVTVKLKEADGLTGSTILELVDHEDGAEIPGMQKTSKKGKNRRKHGKKQGHKQKRKRKRH